VRKNGSVFSGASHLNSYRNYHNSNYTTTIAKLPLSPRVTFSMAADVDGNHRQADYEPTNTKAATQTHNIGLVYPASFLNNTKRTAVLVMDPDRDVSTCGSQHPVASKAFFLRLDQDPATVRQSSVVAALLEGMWTVPQPPGGVGAHGLRSSTAASRTATAPP
jgi:hypothetical protein